MSTRRDFLFSVLATAALPGAVGAAGFDRSNPVRVIAETACADARAFGGHFSLGKRTPSIDPRNFLFSLERELASERPTFVYGLTRESNRFLVEQCAGAYGYRRVYLGDHRYRKGGLLHCLEGGTTALDELARSFGRGPMRWTGILSQALPLLSRADPGTQRLEVFAATRRPADSSGHLVSWLLRSA